MFHCYKSYDFVDYLICKLDKISNTTYIKEYRKLIPSLKYLKNIDLMLNNWCAC